MLRACNAGGHTESVVRVRMRTKYAHAQPSVIHSRNNFHLSESVNRLEQARKSYSIADRDVTKPV